MSDLQAQSGIKRMEIEAVVIRADGTREELGVVSTSSRGLRGWLTHFLAARRIRKANEHVKEA